MIDLKTFQDKTDIYGGDLSRWPKELLPAAVATLKQMPEAEDILAQALALDAEIASLAVPPLSPAFRAVLVGIPDEQSTPAMMRWLMSPARLAVGVALFGILGLSVGISETRLMTQESNESAWVFAPDQTTENDYAMLD